MSASSAPYVVVVGIDFSPASEIVLERAFDTSDRHSGAQVHVITVARGSGDELELDGGDAGARLTADKAANVLRRYVEGQLQKLQSTPPENVEHVVTHLGVGDPGEEIAQLAIELEADLVVVGAHGHRGFRKLVLGSVADKVLRLAHAPVLIVQAKEYSGESSVPKIAAACPRCLEVRRQTSGKDLWCEQHAETHGRRHTYHFSRMPGAHSSGWLVSEFRH